MTIKFFQSGEIVAQGRTQRGGGGGAMGATAPPPPEKTIFTIFRMSLLVILWIFGAFFSIQALLPPVKKSCVMALLLQINFES